MFWGLGMFSMCQVAYRSIYLTPIWIRKTTCPCTTKIIVEAWNYCLQTDLLIPIISALPLAEQVFVLSSFRALPLWNSLKTHKYHSAALPSIFAEQKSTRILGWLVFFLQMLLYIRRFFVPRIGMALKKENIKSLLFPFRSNRNENFKQECLTVLTK